jgi:cellulose synthase/poly-beta-1,6-N-acetylglucosamine synthase-like glycosyltransferase
MTLRASVIITTHNEGASIRATLLGLAQDRAFREGWAEVVLVDDRSTDDTVAQALSVDLPALRLLRAAPDPASPLTTRQQALDLGFRAAASPIILTLDADSTLPRDWIAQMIAPIEAGQTQAIAGPIGFAPLTSGVARWQCCDTAYYFLVSGLMARAGLGGGVFFGNFAFRADLYTRLGGFDAIGFALTEDLAFALALQRAGHRIGFAAGTARVDVRPCPSIPALVERSLRVTSGPPSALALVLTVWPLTLLGLAIATALGVGATVAAALLLRYLTGVMIVIRALGPRRSARLYVAALGYEPAVFGLAAAALLRRLARRGVAWGGKTYGQ